MSVVMHCEHMACFKLGNVRLNQFTQTYQFSTPVKFHKVLIFIFLKAPMVMYSLTYGWTTFLI